MFRWLNAIVLILLVLQICGCGPKLDNAEPSKIEKVSTGMTLAQVQELLGEGQKIEPGKFPGIERVSKVDSFHMWPFKDLDFFCGFSDGKVAEIRKQTKTQE